MCMYEYCMIFIKNLGVVFVIKVLKDIYLYFYFWYFIFCRINRIYFKEVFYVVGVLIKGRFNNVDYEDDIIRILGVELVFDIIFFLRF